MPAPKWIPGPAEVARETIIVLAGAIAAAAIIGMLPKVRAWMREQWSGANPSV